VRGFKHDLVQASAVISNAGFELISEALLLQKKILVKPLHGQMEQASNALALCTLQLAQRTDVLTTEVIANWLAADKAPQQVQYPNVAAALCQQLISGLCPPGGGNRQFDIEALWQQSRFLQPSLLPVS
jgi:predicted glycosyltransferase